jgi:flavin-dependent thymidylate synthase
MSNQIKVELQEHMGSDRSIAEAAWTSSLLYSQKASRTEEDVKRVVKMLADQKHATPFESVVMKFWIKMPIMIDRQHMTHRIGSHNGMSARYRTMPSEFLQLPDDVKNILDSIDPSLSVDYTTYSQQANDYYETVVSSLKAAEKLCVITNSELKRAREIVRGVLPQSNMTERVTIFNLRSFANYQKLRNTDHAQPEIKQVAELMLQAVKNANICPTAVEWLENNNWSL